jgi:hypothetical protein
MPTVAIIACGNGFGHVRRCLLIAEALAGHGAGVTLFAPALAIQRIDRSVGVSDRLTIVDFDTATSAESLRAAEADTAHWEQRLPPLDRFDVVLCDNLPEVLAVRQDAILSGNFLWHQALPDIATEIRVRAEALLAQHRPLMITYGPFAAKQLKYAVRCLPVSLIQARRQVAGDERNALLITCGNSHAMWSETKSLIALVASGPKPTVAEVFVEPDLLPADAPVWMGAADYSLAMYDRLLCAIARPGMGTVSDCLASGVRVFAFHEQGNFEMADNSRQLEVLEVGECCADGSDAWSRASVYLQNIQGRSAPTDAFDRLEFGGTETAALHVLKALENKCSLTEHRA